MVLRGAPKKVSAVSRITLFIKVIRLNPMEAGELVNNGEKA